MGTITGQEPRQTPSPLIVFMASSADRRLAGLRDRGGLGEARKWLRLAFEADAPDAIAVVRDSLIQLPSSRHQTALLQR